MNRYSFLKSKKKKPKETPKQKRVKSAAIKCVNILAHPERESIDRLFMEGHTSAEIAWMTTWWYESRPALIVTEPELRAYRRHFLRPLLS